MGQDGVAILEQAQQILAYGSIDPDIFLVNGPGFLFQPQAQLFNVCRVAIIALEA